MSTLEQADQRWITDQLASGNVILFLGSGASIGAQSDNGEKPLSALELRNELSDTFLNGELRNEPLSHVAEIAKSTSNLLDVQQFIAERFKALRPAPFHTLITKFKWHAIVTTNYDLIVEQAYQESDHPLQTLTPVIQDGDLRAATEKPNSLPLLKIHGCVTHINDPSLPLILATEEYAKHKRNRENIFRALQDWARSYPIFFCGYDISDPNITQILWDVGDTSNSRPRYVTVNPGLIDVQLSYWRDRRFIPLPQTFQSFLEDQDQKVPTHKRVLGGISNESSLSISKWIPSHETPTESLASYISTDLVHVYPEMDSDGVTPAQFYSGFSNSWYAYSQKLDIERRVSSDIAIEAILEEEHERPRFFILKGHAGSGKSVVLQRLAWDSANEYEKLVFFINENSIIDINLIEEIFNLTKESFYLFIDDAIPNTHQIKSLYEHLHRKSIPVTIIAAARTNEWNVWGDSLEAILDKSYEITNLSEKEIKQLLSSLERHGCLGELTDTPFEKILEYFTLSAERQLLVALHEATNAKSFHEIISDELNKLTPLEAKQLYLDICTLHRFGVVARAGIISRTSEIHFEDFQERLFKPLQHVVKTVKDTKTRDIAYKTRHRIIADMAFESAFRDPESRANQIIRIIKNMNIEYESDEIAFRELIRGKTMAEAFSEKQLCVNIFEAAKESGAPLSYILHQRAILEINHPSGTLKNALNIARDSEANAVSEKGIDNRAILHTKAIILQRLAKESDSIPEKEKFRQDSKHLLKKQLPTSKTSHAHSALISVLIDELEDKLSHISSGSEDTGDLTSQAITNLIREIDELLEEGLRRFPSDEQLKSEEARLAQNLKHQRRAQSALETAFNKNKGNAFVAVRLARFYQDSGDTQKAQNTLDECLRVNPTEKRAHLQYAKLLRKIDESGYKDQIRSHLRKSFSNGDSNYEGQFWYARHHFLYGERDEYKKIYKDLKKATMPPNKRREKRGFLENQEGKRVIIEGTVTQVSSDYCFIRTIEYKDNIFAHFTGFHEGVFEKLATGDRVKFWLAFTFNGPCADNVTRSR